MSEHLADLIVDHYERHARDWDADRRTLPWVDRPWVDLFAALLATGGAVLDPTCSGGDPIAAALAARGLRVTGVDASPTLISLRRETMPDHHGLLGDLRSLVLGDRFDGVIAWDSFFHLKPDDPAAMFPGFAAHAAPGAVLMFNAGPARGEAIGAYRGDPLYHASLAAAEYEHLLDDTIPASTCWSTSSATSRKAGGWSVSRGDDERHGTPTARHRLHHRPQVPDLRISAPRHEVGHRGPRPLVHIRWGRERGTGTSSGRERALPEEVA